MRILFGNNKSQNRRTKRGLVLYIALVAVGLLLIAAASRDLYSKQHEDFTARSEYDQLRELFYSPPAYPEPVSDPESAYRPADEDPESGNRNRQYANQETPGSEQPDALALLFGINPDFIGWITIEGVIDYPVVRGSDNSVYLNKTFTGNLNPAGAVFMDYRLTRGFDAPVCILYGHNMRDGSMFAQLNRYLDPEFMKDHPDIIVMTLEGEILIYRVFEAKRTDMRDRIYDFDFQEDVPAIPDFGGGAGSAGRYLLLSTCTPGPDRDERLLVFAALAGQPRQLIIDLSAQEAS